MTQDPTPSPSPIHSPPVHDRPHTVILRPWPKIIFFYPTMLAALIVGTWQVLDKEPVVMTRAGLAFFAILALNFLVVAFEFSRWKSVALLGFTLALLFGLLYAAKQFDLPIFEFLRDLVMRLEITASPSFYFFLGGYLLLLFLSIFVSTRWNYYEIRHNEIVHHTGFLGDIRRFPSPSLKMTKEINDVFELFILGSGRIILYPASEKEAIVLDNVLNVNRVERELKNLLSILSVEVTGHSQGEVDS